MAGRDARPWPENRSPPEAGGAGDGLHPPGRQRYAVARCSGFCGSATAPPTSRIDPAAVPRRRRISGAVHARGRYGADQPVWSAS